MSPPRTFLNRILGSIFMARRPRWEQNCFFLNNLVRNSPADVLNTTIAAYSGNFGMPFAGHHLHAGSGSFTPTVGKVSLDVKIIHLCAPTYSISITSPWL